jgi:DNA mismatch endonuclease (patch repair protein)
VFVHGCFWHRCPSCDLPRPKAHREFWDAKFAENLARDSKAESALIADGWIPVVIWEHEIRNDLGGAIARTIDLVRRRRAAT